MVDMKWHRVRNELPPEDVRVIGKIGKKIFETCYFYVPHSYEELDGGYSWEDDIVPTYWAFKEQNKCQDQ